MIDFLESLTPREREVYDLRTTAHTNNEMARKLYISNRTVEIFVGNITEKARVHGYIWTKSLIKKPEGKAGNT